MHIHPYIGYRYRSRLFFHGRLLDNPRIRHTDTTTRRGLHRIIQSLWTHERPDIPIHMYDPLLLSTVTDDEGYYRLRHAELNDGLQDTTECCLSALHYRSQRAWQPYLWYPDHTHHGIITDVDDTILHTHTRSLLGLKMLFHTFFIPIEKRKTIHHIAGVYRVMSNQGQLPIFYVSNSPTNIHDTLLYFNHLNNFPQGPILLRDYGIPHARQRRQMKNHKMNTIAQLMQDFPDIKWTLIGDDTSHDAQIYTAAAHRFPNRIEEIFIRDTGYGTERLRDYPSIRLWTQAEELLRMSTLV